MTHGPNDKDNTIIVAPPKFDPEEYREDWAHVDISQEQFNNYLEVLWDIAQTFVLLGYNADISQIMMGHIAKSAGPDSDNLLDSDHSENFNGRAQNNAEESKKT